jgi:GTP cyclohydrolase IA
MFDSDADNGDASFSSMPSSARPTRKAAEEAVRTLIAWAGDDPDRPALLNTPARVAAAYEEFFSGYQQNPETCLAARYESGVQGYQDVMIVRDIRVESHCEHHMVPMVGKAHIGYIPNGEVVGLSKIARLVDIYAKRLQMQEALTVQIADALYRILSPVGVAVVLTLQHDCMCRRGVRKKESQTVTTHMLGCFRKDKAFYEQFCALLKLSD